MTLTLTPVGMLMVVCAVLLLLASIGIVWFLVWAERWEKEREEAQERER